MFGAWTEQQLHLKQNEGGADWEAKIGGKQQKPS